jgi:hypothetical protein
MHRQHLQEDVRGLVPGEPEEPHLPLLLRLDRLGQRTPLDDPVRVVVVVDLVELPQVEVVGAESPQTVLQVLAGSGRVAGAVLGHQEHVLPPPAVGQRTAHQFLAAAVVVVPGVVEEGEPAVGGPLDETDTLVVGEFRLAAVPAAETQHGHARAGGPERAGGHGHGGLLKGVL